MSKLALAHIAVAALVAVWQAQVAFAGGPSSEAVPVAFHVRRRFLSQTRSLLRYSLWAARWLLVDFNFIVNKLSFGVLSAWDGRGRRVATACHVSHTTRPPVRSRLVRRFAKETPQKVHLVFLMPEVATLQTKTLTASKSKDTISLHIQI